MVDGDVLYGMMISTMLECPVGTNSVFSCLPCDGGYKWERDYVKTANDKGWEEDVDTHEQYLNSLAYEVFALYEIYKFKKVPLNHWKFILN